MPAPISSDPQLLLVPEVAALARVSVATVRYWIATGRLPSLKPGRRVMVRLVALQQFLANAERVVREERGGAR